jgi:ATP-binding cassette subfamily B protein/subfamily B ATP-binding cassette protein MsbA
MGMTASPQALLPVIIVSGILLFAITAMLGVLSDWGWTWVGRRIAYDLAQNIFAKLQRRSLIYHSRISVGETITRITSDCWSVHNLFNTLVFQPAHASIAIALMLTFMLQINLVLTAVALAAAPVIVAGSLVVAQRMRAVTETRRRLEGRMRAHVHQIVSGMPVVQAFTREEQEEQRFRAFASESVRAQQRGTLVAGFNTLVSSLGAILGNAIVLLMGAHEVLAGRLTIGDLLVFVAYVTSLHGQMRHFALIYPTVRTLGPSIDRLDEVLQSGPEVVERPGAPPLPEARGEVCFEGVSFLYDFDRPILREVSFTVEPGQTVAIVGPSGVGKSTLVSFIPRFVDPATGRVLIDGLDVREVQLASLRQQVALVLQEPFLFPRTIAENIAYARPDASRAQVEAVAHAANAHTFISRLPDGYDTVIGERGATLSVGERQRISLARALLKDARILILDEPTSGLDAETEALIVDALRKLASRRTTFIVAHRLATIRHADRIMVMWNGTIAESGTHDELIRAGGIYAGYARAPRARTPEPLVG